MENLLKISGDKLTFFRCSLGPGWSAEIKNPGNTKKELLERLNWIAGMFNEDGTYNFDNLDIEEYGYCLWQDNAEDEALKIFDGIVGNNSNILLINEPKNPGYSLCQFARQKGKLGFESLLAYGQICQKNHMGNKAYRILREFYEKIPVKCGPERVQAVLVTALSIMQKLKQGKDLEKKLIEARKNLS